MEYTFAQYQESADAIRARIGAFQPEVGLILGSGLGFLGDEVENAVAVHIRHLRSKIEIDPTEPRYLKVVWGKGYKMEERRNEKAAR